MSDKFISLLYPTHSSYTAHLTSRPNISDRVCEELGLATALSLRNSRLSDYFTAAPEVITFRQAVLSDIMRLPGVSDTLRQALPILSDITELRRLGQQMSSASGDSYLYSITEIELYVSAIDTLHGGFSQIKEDLTSEGLLRLVHLVNELVESEDYRELNEGLSRLSRRIHEVKSITVGVNLDAQLRPCEAGVISINSDKFHSGTALDKILRMSFRSDAMTCIASLTPFGKGQSDNRREALIGAFNTAIEEVFRSSVRGWRSIVGEYVLDNTDFILGILPEIEFLMRAAELQQQLAGRGYALACPTIAPAESKTFTAHALYNPDVALRITEPIVPNDFSFDDAGRIFVITGPNRGGKSVLTCAVGIAQCMAQLGMQVCAADAELSPVDGIYTHFPQGADDTIDKGRLGEECARLQQIFESVTADSMILLDESLSSTGAYEASYIAADILRGFAAAGCRGIFSTHLHDLASAVPDISRASLSDGGVAIDTMTAEVGEENKRSFSVVRSRPDGRSYATDIARRYGLDYDSIKSIINRK